MVTEPNVEVSAELRELVEKAIDQAEGAFGLFFGAARRSTAEIPASESELTRQVIAFSEVSLKTSSAHAREVASTASLHEMAVSQSELVKRQIADAERHIRELARTLGPKYPT